MPVNRIISVVGARPNFMKIAPFIHALEARNLAAIEAGDPAPIEHFLVHTGQHYDHAMSRQFFETLNIPDPHVNLEIGSGTHAEQVGHAMIKIERVITELRPDWVVVVGDVNATCASAITAKKCNVKLAHIESGLRSHDLSMPEEINRIVTDRLADLLFTSDWIADRNLEKEGVPSERIMQVGNIMIDTLEQNRAAAEKMDHVEVIESQLLDSNVDRDTPALNNDFAVLTMHRPSNVDDSGTLGALIDYFAEEITAEMPLVWPIHPRTVGRLKAFGLWNRVAECPRIFPLKPISYTEMLCLNLRARIMLTDSGGLQEECCITGTPCVTIRENTERPVTLATHGGVSTLAGHDVNRLRATFNELRHRPKEAWRPPQWDGHTAERIVDAFAKPQPSRTSRLQVDEC